MKRRDFNKNLAATAAVFQLPFSLARVARGAATGAGATQVFNFANFTNALSNGLVVTNDANLSNSPGNLNLNTIGNGAINHNHGGAWYGTKQPAGAFTTQFTFALLKLGIPSTSQTVANPGVFNTSSQSTYSSGARSFQSGNAVMLSGSAAPGGFSLNTIYYVVSSNLSDTTCSLAKTPGGPAIQCTSSVACTIAFPVSSGITFSISNSSATMGGGDANMCGYSGANDQGPPSNYLAIKFDADDLSKTGYYPSIYNYPGGFPSSTGLYFNGAPDISPGHNLGLVPYNALGPYGINFYTGNVHQVTIVYDGSLLTMVLRDTVTNAQARIAWPLNLSNTTSSASAGNYVGFTGGTARTGTNQIQTWQYWSGYNTRLTTPTMSPAPGNFLSAQMVTISYPPGSTCYYTTNGLLPTSSSKQYGGPITVSANQVIQAVAIQSGFTDSLVASGNFVIDSLLNVINFPAGFSAGNLIPVGYAYLSGSAYLVSDTTQATQGAVWFPTLVTVSTFSTTFTLKWGVGGQGMCFVIQNNPQPYASPSPALNVGGGPTLVGFGDNGTNNGLGYGGVGPLPTSGILNSVAIAFNVSSAGSDPVNSIGLYTNGKTPTGSQISTGLNFNSGHPFSVTLSYVATTLIVSITDTVTGATFVHNFTINISSTVGAGTAYVGFTGGTGGAATTQAVQSWTYTAAIGQPAVVPLPPTNFQVK